MGMIIENGMLKIDGKEIKDMNDFPEPLPCGSILSEMIYHITLEPIKE